MAVERLFCSCALCVPGTSALAHGLNKRRTGYLCWRLHWSCTVQHGAQGHLTSDPVIGPATACPIGTGCEGLDFEIPDAVPLLSLLSCSSSLWHQIFILASVFELFTGYCIFKLNASRGVNQPVNAYILLHSCPADPSDLSRQAVFRHQSPSLSLFLRAHRPCLAFFFS